MHLQLPSVMISSVMQRRPSGDDHIPYRVGGGGIIVRFNIKLVPSSTGVMLLSAHLAALETLYLVPASCL